jgi:hypothetical protein
MEPNGGTVAHTKRVIFDVLALDWLVTSQTVESGSKPDADGPGKHERQVARIDPLTDQRAQRGIA